LKDHSDAVIHAVALARRDSTLLPFLLLLQRQRQRRHGSGGYAAALLLPAMPASSARLHDYE
jgi:hypothetical protein